VDPLHVIFAALAVLSELVYYGVALESALFATTSPRRARERVDLSLPSTGVQVDGTAITSARFSVEIARGCDAYRHVRAAHRGDRRVSGAIAAQGRGASRWASLWLNC
jgi:hypothetical protein